MTVEALMAFDRDVLATEKDPAYRTMKLKSFLEKQGVTSKEKITLLIYRFETDVTIAHYYPIMTGAAIIGAALFSFFMMDVPLFWNRQQFYAIEAVVGVLAFVFLIVIPIEDIQRRSRCKRIYSTLLSYYLQL